PPTLTSTLFPYTTLFRSPVLLEMEWVLRSRYEMPPETILGLFRAALEARELAFEDEAAVEEALFNWQDSQSGFSDCLIVAHNRQDRKSTRLNSSHQIISY